MDWGEEAARRLSYISENASLGGPGVTRLPFTEEHRQAVSIIRAWMETAGLEVHLDAAGTLVGRREGPPGARTLLLGSHQDSVPGGGAFDGIMGIALACLAMEALRDENLAVSVEVLAFADEEGVRFPTALMGPRALAGTIAPSILDLQDEHDTTLRDALLQFGGRPDALPDLQRSPDQVAGYLELHIEQGPVLEKLNQPLGIVTAICGIERHALRFLGATGHAGTVPMEERQDALVAASAFIAQVPGVTGNWPGLRATVGTLSVGPGAPNAIPEDVQLVLEVRSESDSDRSSATDALQELATQMAADHDCRLAARRTYEQPAVPCDSELSRRLESAGCSDLPRLPSGATHDASAMADLCPIAMLFVRCRNGVSHRPDEFATAEDMRAGVTLLAKVIEGFRNETG